MVYVGQFTRGIAHAAVQYGVNGQHGLLNGTHGNLPAANRALLSVERRASQLSDWLRQGFVIPIIRGCIPRTRHRLLDCKTSLTFLQIPNSALIMTMSPWMSYHQCFLFINVLKSIGVIIAITKIILIMTIIIMVENDKACGIHSVQYGP